MLLNGIFVVVFFFSTIGKRKCYNEEGLLYFKFMVIVELMFRGHLINVLCVFIEFKKMVGKDFLVVYMKNEFLLLFVYWFFGKV